MQESMMEAQEQGLLTICKGGAVEAFALAFEKILANIQDPTTSVKKVRKITMEFTFTPYPDRSGATAEVSRCNTSLGDLDTSALTCTIHIAKKDGKYLAFSRDLRQELLFTGEEESVPDGKTEAAGS
jgi:hypothetical protein